MSEARAGARSAAALEAPEAILVRYGEIALKGRNRDVFERALARNIRKQTASLAPVSVSAPHGRLVVRAERRVEEVLVRLQRVFGIKSVSPVWRADLELEAIARLAVLVTADARGAHPGERPTPFRVETRRAEKRFPLRSTDVDRQVGARVLAAVPGLAVDLERPELVLEIDLRTEGAWVFARRLAGPGGLPVGTQGRALCLISGGLDSPVAAWMGMKRGLAVSFVSFHSYPYIGEASKEKVVAVVRELATWQPATRLYVAPFAPVQVAIRDAAPEPYRTVLYRRMMQRIATRLAERDGLAALITGESLGQVASQTLENMTLIGAASGLPVLRPLVGFDKEESIALARRIGTFALSSRPEPDCCTVFQPHKPVIHGDAEACARAEAALDVGGLVEASVAGVEVVDIAS